MLKSHFQKILTLFLFLFFGQNSFSQQIESIVNESVIFHSKILQSNFKYSVYIPSGLKDTVPVIYLLYGLGGNEKSWIKRDAIQHILDSTIATGQVEPFIAVMPESRNSYYINNYDSSFLFSDFLKKEFVPFVDSIYTTNCSRKNRAVLGISMGGYGAVVNTIKYPDLFGTCINLSGAVRTDTNIKYVSDAFYDKYLESIYGEGKISTHWINNSPYHLLNDSSSKNLRDIHWYVDAGLNDYLLPANKSFQVLLQKHKIPHEFHVRPGKHEWPYWRTSVIRGILYWGEKM